MQVIPASIASFLVSCTMLLALRPFAEVVGLIDKPGGRKTHHGEVPVVGGIAMFTGLLVAAIGGTGPRARWTGIFCWSWLRLWLSSVRWMIGSICHRRSGCSLISRQRWLWSTAPGLWSAGLGDLVGWRDLCSVCSPCRSRWFPSSHSSTHSTCWTVWMGWLAAAGLVALAGRHGCFLDRRICVNGAGSRQHVGCGGCVPDVQPADATQSLDSDLHGRCG